MSRLPAEQADNHWLYGAEDCVIVFGLDQPPNLRLMATTFKEGDPSYAGAIGGVTRGLESYKIFELRDEIPSDVWKREMSFKEPEVEDELVQQICATMREIRDE